VSGGGGAELLSSSSANALSFKAAGTGRLDVKSGSVLRDGIDSRDVILARSIYNKTKKSHHN
jgi:hypothetical protein